MLIFVCNLSVDLFKKYDNLTFSFLIPSCKTIILKILGSCKCFIFIEIPAELPGAARVNLQPAEHLKNVLITF